MQVSARNKFSGTVIARKWGSVMAEVSVDIGGGHIVVAAITRESADRLNLEEGSPATVIIKATDVIVAAD